MVITLSVWYTALRATTRLKMSSKTGVFGGCLGFRVLCVGQHPKGNELRSIGEISYSNTTCGNDHTTRRKGRQKPCSPAQLGRVSSDTAIGRVVSHVRQFQSGHKVLSSRFLVPFSGKTPEFSFQVKGSRNLSRQRHRQEGGSGGSRVSGEIQPSVARHRDFSATSTETVDKRSHIVEPVSAG